MRKSAILRVAAREDVQEARTVPELAPHLTGPDQAVWLDRLDDEHDTLRAVLARLLADSEAEPAVRLGGALWRFWYARGHIRSGRSWLRWSAIPRTAAP